MFVSVEFSIILLGIEITSINKNFDKTIKISYSRKYIKRDVVFWKLMDNVSSQYTLVFYISSMFHPIKFTFNRFDFFFLAFSLAFSLAFFFSFAFYFEFLFYFPCQFCYYLFLSRFFKSWIFNNMIIGFWHK